MKWTALLGVLMLCMSSLGWTAGGTLRYAVVAEPPSLDQHVLTSDLATTIAQHIFEGLYTFDSSYTPVPMLATGEKTSRDGKTVTISLRRGVKFHNGKEMTSADVVASLERWGKHGSRGKLLFEKIDSVSARGKYTVVMKFNSVFGPWKNLMAFINGGPVIYPQEVMAGAGVEPISKENYLGTGPYKFSDWRPNRYVELVRFDEYANRKEPADGYGGKRDALFDKLQFAPVPDPATRVSGVKAGDYDYAEQIPGDLYDQLNRDSSVKTLVSGASIFGLVFVNSKDGIFKDNYALRRAVLTAIDWNPALKAAVGPDALWEAEGSIFAKGNQWYTTQGADKYSQGNAAAAKSMAEAAGYKGEPIKFMVSPRYSIHYDMAVVVTRQLLEAGFLVDLQVYDWATLISKRAQPDQWDLFFTHHGFVPDPVLVSVLNDNYPGWWITPQKKKLVDAFTATTDVEKRKEVWGQLQALIYEDVPTMKTGDIYTYNIASPSVKGLETSSLIWPSFWGISK